MAILFGFQLIYTAVMAVVLQKIIPHCSLGLKLLTGYKRFIVPSYQDLRAFASNKNSKELRIPNDAEVELKQNVTSRNDVCFLPYFAEFQWLIDFTTRLVF